MALVSTDLYAFGAICCAGCVIRSCSHESNLYRPLCLSVEHKSCHMHLNHQQVENYGTIYDLEFCISNVGQHESEREVSPPAMSMPQSYVCGFRVYQ